MKADFIQRLNNMMSDRLKILEPSHLLPEAAPLHRNILRQFPVLQSVLESLSEGLLIVSESGELWYANEQARRISQQLTQSDRTSIMQEIERVCDSLIESRSLFPDQKLILDSEIVMLDATIVRIQAQWFQSAKIQQACILVTLEDLCNNN
ncbi:MAG: hypothetical protein F6K32_03425 [Desertifilum sp. SIO1I2]|nr:hypothetical protein [Desertifilum sp. SIO1I2]